MNVNITWTFSVRFCQICNLFSMQSHSHSMYTSFESVISPSLERKQPYQPVQIKCRLISLFHPHMYYMMCTHTHLHTEWHDRYDKNSLESQTCLYNHSHRVLVTQSRIITNKCMKSLSFLTVGVPFHLNSTENISKWGTVYTNSGTTLKTHHSSSKTLTLRLSGGMM